MRILLNTHIFLWFISNDTRLPANMRDIIRDLDKTVTTLQKVSILFQT